MQVIYHHTSSLRTNLLWMSGYIDLEGNSKGVIHPELGEIHTDAALRRPMRDFPPLVWFTTRIEVPACLQQSTIVLLDKVTSETRAIDGPEGSSDAIALNRLALGFPIASIPVTPWPEHTGYSTPEGQGLNESARAVGDNPDDWWGSNSPVDLLQMSEIWVSPRIANPKLQRSDHYLIDVRRMVTVARQSGPMVVLPHPKMFPRHCRCLTSMIPVPHGPVPIAASLAAVFSSDVEPKTRLCAIVRRHTFMRRCNVRSCPSG